MAWRGPIAAAAAAALLLAAAPGAAAQACEPPKAWHTAALQLEHDVGLELGLLEQHTRELREQPSSAFVPATVTYGRQRVESSLHLTSATARFLRTVVTTPPSCR